MTSPSCIICTYVGLLVMNVSVLFSSYSFLSSIEERYLLLYLWLAQVHWLRAPGSWRRWVHTAAAHPEVTVLLSPLNIRRSIKGKIKIKRKRLDMWCSIFVLDKSRKVLTFIFIFIERESLKFIGVVQHPYLERSRSFFFLFIIRVGCKNDFAN